MGTITEQDEGNGVTLVTESNIELKTAGLVETERRIASLETELRDLKVKLFGDEEAEQRYAENRRTYVTPNIPKPSPGSIDLLIEAIRQINSTTDSIADNVSVRMNLFDQQLAFSRKLEAFFGPMLANKNPPLDGAQIVARSELDEALARLSGALRDEWAESKHFTDQIEREFREVLPRESVQLDRNHSPADRKNNRLLRLSHIATFVRYAYDRVIKIDAERGRPSRLQLAKAMFRTIVTGKEAGQP